MSLPEFTTRIRIPKREFDNPAPYFISGPCLKVLYLSANYVIRVRKATIGHVAYPESGHGKMMAFVDRSCLMKLRTSSLPEGVIVAADEEGDLNFRCKSSAPEKMGEAKAIFDHIASVFASKVAQLVLKHMGYATEMAVVIERYGMRIRVMGTRSIGEQPSSSPASGGDRAKIVKAVVLPTTNMFLFLEGFGREEEAEEIKRLRERFEWVGLFLRDVERPVTRH